MHEVLSTRTVDELQVISRFLADSIDNAVAPS
jgi:hypothetical protein